MVNVNKVKDYYRRLLSMNYSWTEFMTALAILERGYAFDDINDLTDEEIATLADEIDSYDYALSYDVNAAVDEILNYPRENN